MSTAWMVPALSAVLLYVAVAIYIARGPFRRFLFVFLYCLAQALTGIVVSLTYLDLGLRRDLYQTIFWTTDFVSHALITLILVSLIRESLESSPDLKRLAIPLVPLAVLCVAIGSAFTFRSHYLSTWMTPVSRNLSFCEELLNFMLWTILIRKRDYDRLLLFISAGIGVQVTGEVIGNTIRMFIKDPTILWLPSTLVSGAEFSCLLTWVWAFHASRLGRGAWAPSVASHQDTSAVLGEKRRSTAASVDPARPRE